MRSDYLIAGVVLVGLGLVQLWANGRWPFRMAADQEREGSPGEAGPPDEKEIDREAASGGLWRSWTKVAGYVAIALGILALVLAVMR